MVYWFTKRLRAFISAPSRVNYNAFALVYWFTFLRFSALQLVNQ